MKIYLNEGNAVIILFGHSRYIKELKSYYEPFQNRKLINAIDLIGKNYGDIIKGKGKERHKGIKMIIKHCHDKYQKTITGREIKSLFKSFEKHDDETTFEVVRFPYSSALILKSIVELTEDIDECKKTYIEFIKEHSMSGINCRDFYIPKVYQVLRLYNFEIERKEAQSGKPFIMKKLKFKLLNAQKELEDKFIEDCYS